MDDAKRLLERQAAWQRSRKSLSWPEKIKMAEMMRDAVRQIRSSGPALKPKTLRRLRRSS